VLKTIGVLVAAMFLGIAVLGSLVWLTVIAVPVHWSLYAYYLASALTGAAVGCFVGFLQKGRPGLVALTSLLPAVLLQYVNRYAQPEKGLRLALLVLGTAIELAIAFATAERLGTTRGRTGELGQIASH